MARKVNKLSDLQIDEVSLVDKPANPHAEVLLSKRDDDESDLDEELGKNAPDPSGMHVPGGDYRDDDEDEDDEEKRRRKKEKNKESYEKGFFSNLVNKILIGESTTPEGHDGNISHEDDVSKVGPQGMNLPYGQQMMGQPAPGPQGGMPGMPGMGGAQAFPAMGGQMPGQMQSGPQLPDEVIQYIRALEQQVAEQQGQGQGRQQQAPGKEDMNVNPFGKRDEELSADELSFLQDLAKNLEDDEQREAVNKAMDEVRKANERAEQAEQIAKAEREHRMNQVYIEKARSFVGLPVNAQEFGPVLKRLHETMSEEDVDVIEKALSAANETIASGGFFSEIGKGTGFGADLEPISKIDQEAKALVEKSDGMSMEAARAQVIEQNPALYDEYLREVQSR